MRIEKHSILGPSPYRTEIAITVDGEAVPARAGEPIAVAMMAAGLWACRFTPKLDQPRGVFCGNGQCGECRVTVDGKPNVLACREPAQAGQVVQRGRGLWQL